MVMFLRSAKFFQYFVLFLKLSLQEIFLVSLGFYYKTEFFGPSILLVFSDWLI